ncbi:uncharacterized protein EI90DRAFT_3158216 [Cantharellus anzutake]|uniref:uncharacterized protein n=1 Tax=Cantharellus anzutake TaxID=1750568 RepID=UPI0019047650|nr:uncharacterized protein EI90DRAFT_3158216 [Cantharellus anzutake]KAF8319882.1 hypothetical protein EI90DRAFT_3158216 [Cantharellus anzutake]
MPNIMQDHLQDLHRKVKNYQYPTIRDPNRTLPPFPKVISNLLLWDHLKKLGFIDRSEPIEKPMSTGFKTASNVSIGDVASRSLRVFLSWDEYATEESFEEPNALSEQQKNMEVFAHLMEADGSVDESVEKLPDFLNVLPSNWKEITLGDLATLNDGFEMLEVVAATLCLSTLKGKTVDHRVSTFRECRTMLKKNKQMFEFIVRLLLPRHEGTTPTEMDTERNVGAAIMPFFDISSNPSFFCHSNQPSITPPIMGFGSTTPHPDLLTSVGFNELMGIRVGIFIGEAKRPETKGAPHANTRLTPASSSLSVPKQPAAKSNFTQALNQTFLASLPILSLIALAATNGTQFSPSNPPPLPKHGFVFGLRYSSAMIVVDVMFPSWEQEAVGAPDAPSPGWVYNTINLGTFAISDTFFGGQLSGEVLKFLEVMAAILEHNNRLFEELSAASFHEIVGEAFKVWRHGIDDEGSWLENLLLLDPAYVEVLGREDVATIRDDYHKRHEEKEREKREKGEKKGKEGKGKDKGKGGAHTLEEKMAALVVGEPIAKH